MKKKITLIFISIFVAFGLVFGTLCLTANIPLSTGTSTSSERADDETSAEATPSGNWSENYGSWSYRGNTSSGHLEVYIYTAAELAALAQFVKSNVQASGTTYYFSDSSTVVTLKNDIDMSAHYWDYGIGDGSHPFKGTFNGQGYTISGLRINLTSSTLSSFTTAYNGVYGIGLFGVLEGASIRDLVLESGSYKVESSSLTGSAIRLGSVAGLCVGYSTFYRVVNNGVSLSINYASYTWDWWYDSAIGGLVGTVYSAYFADCYNFGTITSDDFTNISVGGILGTADQYADIYRCGNFTNIEGSLSRANSSGYGGIVAMIAKESSWSKIEDCVNYGNVKISSSNSKQSSYVGGIIGVGVQSVYVNRCINYGDIYGTNYVGGIAGRMGSPKEVSQFLWITWTSKEANEDVMIANSINYGNVTGTSNWGLIVGEMNGAGNIRGCYILSANSNGVGNWNNGSSSLANIDYWWKSIGYLHMAEFFVGDVYGSGGIHQYNWSGSTTNTYISGWSSSIVKINGGATTGWVITTMAYDKFAKGRDGFTSSYPYSLVPTSLIGTATFSAYYYCGTTRTQFTADDSKVMTINYSCIEGDSVEDKSLLGGGTFYYLRYTTSAQQYTPLKFTYNDSWFKPKSVTSSINLNCDWYSYYSYAGARGNYLKFDSGTSNTLTIQADFTNIAQTLQVTYKLGQLGKIEYGENAYYEWNIAVGLSLGSDYENNYLKISGVKEKYYYNSSVDLSVTPSYGYAILYVLNTTQGSSDDYDSSLSVSENEPKYSYGTSGAITSITPQKLVGKDENGNDEYGYNFGLVNVKYDYSYGCTLTIYVIPISYQLKLVFTDGDPESNSPSTSLGIFAFTGISGTSGIGAALVLYTDTEPKVDNGVYHTSNAVKKYFDYGYTYKFYGWTASKSDPNEDTHSGFVDEDHILNLIEPGQSTNQLNPDKYIAFEMLELIEKATGTTGTRGNELYIYVVRTAIEYEVEFVNMVDSFTSPDIYSDQTDNGIGGESTISISNTSSGSNNTSYTVGNKISLSFNAKNGYCSMGQTYNSNTTTFTKDDKVSFTTFSDLLKDYLKNHCDNDVTKLPGYNENGPTIVIYAYYKLKQYELKYQVMLDEDNKGPTAATFTVTSTNAQNKGNGLYSVYYYAPTEIKVGNITNARFLGWYMGNNLLSLQQNYKFFVDPTEGYLTEVTLTAKFASYSYSTEELTESHKVITISNADDLIKLSTRVNSGDSLEGYIVKQTANIDMSDKTFNPIGTESTPFKGTYDGQNHIISNIKFVGVKETDDGELNYGELNNLFDIGLFGYTDGATIKNLTIKDSDYTAFGHVGIFVANASNTALSNLNNFNCNINPTKVTFWNIYGQELTNFGSTYSEVNYYYYYNSENTPNDGVVLKKDEIDEIKELTNAGIISVVTNIIPEIRLLFGGLVGKMTGGSLYACSVNASLDFSLFSSTDSYVGGLVGESEELNNKSVTIDQCFVENSAGIKYCLSAGNDSYTNCYYRYKDKSAIQTVYYGVEDSLDLDSDIWFKLPNGCWTLRVFYWS